MAEKGIRISELCAASAVTGSEKIVIVTNDGITKSISIDQIGGGTGATGTYLTGGTYNPNNGELSFTNTVGGGFTVTGLESNGISGVTFDNSTYDLTLEKNDGTSLQTNLAVLASDVFVLQGAYEPSTGDVTFTNSSGGTFVVSGFTTGMTDTFVDSGTFNDSTYEVNFNKNVGPGFNLDLSEIKNDIDGNTNNINTLSGQVETLSGQVETLSANTVQSDLGETDNTSPSFVSGKTADNITYDDTTTGLGATDVQGAVEVLDSRLDTAEDNINTISGDVQTISGDVQTISGDVITLSGQVADLDSGKLVSGTFDKVNGELSLENSTGGTIDVTGFTFDAEDITYDDTTTGLGATDVQGAVEVLDGRLDIAEDNINTISGDVQTISGDVQTISGDVQTISGDVQTISGDVITLSGQVADLSGGAIVSGTFDKVNGELSLENSTGGTIDVTGFTFNSDDISYSSVTSGLSGDTVTEAIDEIDGRLDVVEDNINTISGDVQTISGDVITLSGQVADLSGSSVSAITFDELTNTLTLETGNGDLSTSLSGLSSDRYVTEGDFNKTGGTITLNTNSGDTVEITGITFNASDISYDNTNTTGLTATTVQEVIEELDETLNALANPVDAKPIIASVSLNNAIDASLINVNVLTLTGGLVDFLGVRNRVLYDFTPEIADDVRFQILLEGLDISLLQTNDIYKLQYFVPDGTQTLGVDNGVWNDIAVQQANDVTILSANTLLGDTVLVRSDWFPIPNELRTQSTFNPSNDYIVRLISERSQTGIGIVDVNVNIGRVSFEIRGSGVNVFSVSGGTSNPEDIGYVYNVDNNDPKLATNVDAALDRIITKIDGGTF